MKKQKHSQAGFAAVIILVVIIIAAAVGFAAFKVFKNKPAKNDKANSSQSNSATSSSQRSDGIVMKSIGFNLGDFNEATQSAGDMVFTKLPLNFDQIWGDFGQQDPRSPNDPTKRNPQPVYILPLGTKVLSLIDGTVTKVETLYSGDTTIWVSPGESSKLNFETEHVNKPLVKVGDKVKSGQPIAEVSDVDSRYHPGFGLLEIGVLGQNGNQPAHNCPYNYLDESIKTDIFTKITAVHAAWEKYLGKDIYGDKYAVPGCVTLDPVNG